MSNRIHEPIPILSPPVGSHLLFIVSDVQRVHYSVGVPIFITSHYPTALAVFQATEPELAFAYDKDEPMMHLSQYTIDRTGWVTNARILHQKVGEGNRSLY